jgi:hypothetical protein
VHFRIDRTSSRTSNSILVYRPEEYSFDVEPSPGRSFTSLLLDDLNLEVDDAGRIISVWGMCPHTRWQSARLTAPQASFGELFVVPYVPLSQGPVHLDSESRWVRVGGQETPAASVKLLPGVIFDLTEEGQISALWLRPHKTENLL